MTKPNLEEIQPITDFKREREELEEILKELPSLSDRTNLCLYVSRLYKMAAQYAPEGKIRREMLNEANYFFKQSIDYSREDSTQLETIPTSLGIVLNPEEE